MKMLIAAFLLSLLLASPLASQTATKQDKPLKSDRRSWKLLGPVQTLRYEWCMLAVEPDESGEYKEGGHNYIHTLTFDISGKLVLQDPPPYDTDTSEHIETDEKHHRKYDEAGNEIEDIVTDLEGRVIKKVLQAFDSRGNRTELAYHFPNRTRDFKWVKRFDDRGNEVEHIQYGDGGVIEFKEVRAYNERRHLIEYALYKSDGSLDWKTITEYEYDSHGNWVKSTTYDVITKEGKPFFKPNRIDHQTITYHTDSPPYPGERQKARSEGAAKEAACPEAVTDCP
jgi:hypothetical protein